MTGSEVWRRLVTDERPVCDLVDGRFYAQDSHRHFRWMRAHEPVYRDEKNDLWGITLHEDVMAVSKDSATFCSGQGFRPDAPNMPMMINMDRPEHMVRRNLVNRGFTPRRVADMEDKVRRVCGEILDAVCERGECDFVRDVAAPLPMIMIGDMLGVLPEDRDDLLRWSDVMLTAVGSPEPGMMAEAGRAMSEYTAYNRRVVAERRAASGHDDLIATLVNAEVDGERLDDDSILYESLLILIGGDETTRHVISGGMYQLIRHPEQRERLAADPSAIPRAVEEMLRFVTPIQNMMRTVTRDVVVRDQELKEGDRLLLLYPSANRDESVFAEPDRFDSARDPNPHVAFGGYGNHFCLGNALARLELRVIFEELLRRLPDMALVEAEEPALRAANFVTGYERMPVRFTPRAPERR
ncbi:MAG: cytochrome P450 [Proteobacteria bacterium]|nr:cytochrome P450 [Pseudomonadota bacterium]